MSDSTLRWLERIALAWILACLLLVAVMAVAWGPNVLYFATPFLGASVLIVGVRLWARRVDGLPLLGRSRGPEWRESWEQQQGYGPDPRR
jgi:hypothetical protein